MTGSSRLTIAGLLLLGLLVANQVLEPGSQAADPGDNDNVEITRFSLTILSRELFSFSITRTLDREHE